MTATLPHPAIRPATPADMDGVCGTIARAFASGPVAEWVDPNPMTRAGLYRSFAEANYTKALVNGDVWTTEDYAGAAVWFEVGGDETRPQPWTPEDLIGVSARTGDAMVSLAAPAHDRAMRRLIELDHETARRYPQSLHRDRPYHQLAYLAVGPDRQRQGIGTALLKHYLAIIDEREEPSWLVATSIDSSRLYRRHAYGLVEFFDMGPGTPSLYSMWREPHGAIWKPRAW